MEIFNNNIINKINKGSNDIPHSEVHQSINGDINQRKKFKNKILYLPIIKNNSYFWEKNPDDIHKRYLEGFKPKEDKKIRHKIKSNHINNGLNIKNLSFDQIKSDENILLLVKKIKINNSKRNKIINDDLFNNDMATKKNLIILNKYYNSLNNTEIKSYPHKIKKILITEPNLSYDGININNNFTSSENKINEFNYSSYSKRINDKIKEKNNKLIIRNIFFKWTDEINFNYFNNINSKLIKKKIDGLNISDDSPFNFLIGTEKIKNIDNKLIKSADLSKYNHNRNKIKFNFEKNIDDSNKNPEINKSFDKINIVNKDKDDIKNLKSEKSNVISIKESSQNKSNSFIQNIEENNDKNNNLHKEQKINKKINSNLSDKKKENTTSQQFQISENENKIKSSKISENINDKSIKNLDSKEKNINNNALISNHEKINKEKKGIDEPINLFRKSNKNDTQKMKNIENDDNYNVNSINSINNLNKKSSNKNFDKIVLNNYSSENDGYKKKIENVHQNNNLTTINSIHDDSTINNDISNLNDKYKIAGKDNNINLDEKLQNNKKYKETNEDISENIYINESKKKEGEIQKNYSNNNIKNENILNNNKNLNKNTYKTSYNNNILRNKSDEFNLKKLNFNKRDCSFELSQNKNKYNNNNYNNKKIENAYISTFTKRKSTANLSMKKESKKSETKSKMRLSFISPGKISKKIKPINNNIKEETNNISFKSRKDKITLDKIKSNKSLNRKLNIFNDEEMIKRIKNDETKNQNLSEESESEEKELEIELVKITKKKITNRNDLNSLINSLNNLEEDITKNDLLNINYNNNFDEEKTKNLLLYSAKIKSFSELNNSKKTKEMIQKEKELKQKYNEMIVDYIIKLKYKELLKNNNDNMSTKIKGDINKRRFKIIFEEISEKEDEITWSLKIKEEKINENKNLKVKKEKEKEKELIYDNSYLFKKNKKKKSFVIRKEVLDILETEYNPDEIKNNDFIFNFKSRKSNFTFSKRVKFTKKIKPNKKTFDEYRLSLFSDEKEEKEEKKETEEDKKERFLRGKIKLFYNELQRFKNSEKDFDYFDFLKNRELSEEEDVYRLIKFKENISNFRKKEEFSKRKYNFLSPVEFKTENHLENI